MKLYFVRHGQTDANTRMVSGDQIAELDEPLNELGRKQATELADQLKGADFSVIVTSPLKRALQTAEVINKSHVVPLVTVDAWRERLADTYIDANTWNDLFDFDKNIPVKNGESLHDFFDRVYRAIDQLKAQYQNQTVAVVSHGGVHHALYAYVHQLPRKGNIRISPMKNCEYRIYDV